jgi:hypothetical protein
MGVANIQEASLPSAYDLSVYNAGTTDIPAHTVLVIDASNLMDNGVTGKNNLAVALPAATAGLKAFAVSREIIPAKRTGRAWGPGAVAICIADQAVTAGTYVGTSGSVAGAVVTYTNASPYLGLALTTAADTEEFPVLLCPGTTA